jgi:hypothetical protein
MYQLHLGFFLLSGCNGQNYSENAHNPISKKITLRHPQTKIPKNVLQNNKKTPLIYIGGSFFRTAIFLQHRGVIHLQQ